MQDANKLQIKQLAEELALDVRKITSKFPKEEQYALTQQVWRAIVSVGSNICEGAGRKTSADFSNFLHIANGSLKEVSFQLGLAYKLRYFDIKEYQDIEHKIDLLGAKIGAFIKCVENASSAP